MKLNHSVRVWVRSLGNNCRVRVESLEQARWLIGQLVRHPDFSGIEPLSVESHGSTCTFLIPNTPRCGLAAIEGALAEMPDIHLMLEPESN